MVNPVGRWGEDKAAELLAGYGWKIVARNFQTKYGEIDIVGLVGGTLMIVEVKTRTSGGFGSAISAITPTKLGRLSMAAREFIQQIDWEGPVELAAVTIDGDNPPELVRGLYLDS